MGSRLKEIHQQVFCMSIMFHTTKSIVSLGFEMRTHYSELMRKKSLQEASYLLCDVYFHIWFHM